MLSSAAFAALDSAVVARAAKVKLMIFDIDGVLTDGSLYYGADGEAIKRFNVHDGLGIKLLEQAGIATAIISARQAPIVTRRAQDLGIPFVYQGVHDKRITFAQLLADSGHLAADCGFLGDDVIDLPVLSQAGFAISVPNGHPEVHARVHHVTRLSGGNGAAREVCDMLLRAQGKYDAVMAQF
ncbi:MAG TPA: phenylphosphate carboxylase subunit delta, partial [Burkholderiaceae bacterium]